MSEGQKTFYVKQVLWTAAPILVSVVSFTIRVVNEKRKLSITIAFTVNHPISPYAHPSPSCSSSAPTVSRRANCISNSNSNVAY